VLTEPPPEDIRAVERRASSRASASGSGIGAAVVAALPEDPAGHRRFRLRLSDGRLFGWLEVLVVGRELAANAVEQEVERVALGVPQQRRLLDLERQSPLCLRSGRKA
jgi:hypothetical protein